MVKAHNKTYRLNYFEANSGVKYIHLVVQQVSRTFSS